jgi:hypothetical protein
MHRGRDGVSLAPAAASFNRDRNRPASHHDPKKVQAGLPRHRDEPAWSGQLPILTSRLFGDEESVLEVEVVLVSKSIPPFRRLFR